MVCTRRRGSCCRRSQLLVASNRLCALACVGAACLFFTPVTRGSLCSRCEAVVPAPMPDILGAIEA